jgi:alkaline phosphatase D
MSIKTSPIITSKVIMNFCILSCIAADCRWSEGHYRGYYELHITYDEAKAYYFGYPQIKAPNDTEYLSAEFTVQIGANHIQRPIAGGQVGFGSLKGGTSNNKTLSIS